MRERPEEAEHPHARLLLDLAQAKRDWQQVFDAMVDPMAVLDGEGRVVRANLALARALRRPITEIPRMHYLALLGDPRPPLADPIARSLADGTAMTGEGRFSTLDTLCQITASPLTGEEGGLRGVTVVLRDVTEAREQQQRLVQASRLADVGLLAAGVGHEINTPLASIGLRAESLLRNAADPRLQAIESFQNFPRYLKTILDEVLRCKRIIAALMEFSRARLHEKSATDLNTLVAGAADLLAHEMKRRGVTLSIRKDPRLPPIQADKGQLQQALLALLMNAMDATRSGGHVEVETRAEGGDRVALVVADDGCGIPPEHLERVFSPFFTTKPVGQGMGLGLAVCHGVVAAHGGEIRVESSVDKGTRVVVELPLDGVAHTRRA